jgi:hypothetical protein
MLNLEMAGVGEKLIIYGRGAMVTQLKASARVYSINAILDQEAGGSDDISFLDIGITAGAYAIFPDSDLELAYHRPEDDSQHIQSGSLRTVGILSSHALAAWSGGGPTLPLPSPPSPSSVPVSWRAVPACYLVPPSAGYPC